MKKILTVLTLLVITLCVTNYITYQKYSDAQKQYQESLDFRLSVAREDVGSALEETTRTLSVKADEAVQGFRTNAKATYEHVNERAEETLKELQVNTGEVLEQFNVEFEAQFKQLQSQSEELILSVNQALQDFNEQLKSQKSVTP